MSQVERIVHELMSQRAALVGIDGSPGAGKTAIATMISRQTGFNCLHLDAFVLKGTGKFRDSVRYDRLQSAVLSMQGPIIVEGLCLLAVLEKLAVTPDYLIYVDPDSRYRDEMRSSLLRNEVSDYSMEFMPRSKANAVVSLESIKMNSSYDVDIAYIKSKTMIAVVLAIGGLLQTLSGALLLNAGLNDQGTATLKMMGAEISATGLGGVVLCTSVMWAYFAYLSRPKFSSRSETRTKSGADGSSESYEFKSSTQVIVEPRARTQQGAQADSPASSGPAT